MQSVHFGGIGSFARSLVLTTGIFAAGAVPTAYALGEVKNSSTSKIELAALNPLLPPALVGSLLTLAASLIVGKMRQGKINKLTRLNERLELSNENLRTARASLERDMSGLEGEKAGLTVRNKILTANLGISDEEKATLQGRLKKALSELKANRDYIAGLQKVRIGLVKVYFDGKPHEYKVRLVKVKGKPALLITSIMDSMKFAEPIESEPPTPTSPPTKPTALPKPPLPPSAPKIVIKKPSKTKPLDEEIQIDS